MTSQSDITVNGVRIKIDHEKVLASDILALAVEHGAISGSPDEYVLLSKAPEHEFKATDWVDLLEYKDFYTERSTPTPVAGSRANE